MRKIWIIIALVVGSVLGLITCENPTKAFYPGLYYTVTFDLNDGGAGIPPPDQKVVRGGTIRLPLPEDAPAGYTFNEWQTAGGESAGKNGDTYPPPSDITLYASWTGKSTALAFDVNGGNPLSAEYNGKTAIFGSPMPSLEGAALPEWAAGGCTFTGWFDAPATESSMMTWLSNGQALSGAFAAENGTPVQYYTDKNESARHWDKEDTMATLYAGWVAKKVCTVTLNADGGSGGTSSVTATLGESMPTPIILPTKENFAFGGYWSESEGRGTQYYNADGTSARQWDQEQDATLFALWTDNRFSLIYDEGGGKLDFNGATPAGSYAAGTEIRLPSDGVKEGYTLKNFTLSGGISGPVAAGAFFVMPVGNVIVTANWGDPNSYRLTYDADGGTLDFSDGATPDNSDIEFEVTVTLPRSGSLGADGRFHLSGFTLSREGAPDETKNPGESFTMPAGDVLATALWTELPVYTITFNLNTTNSSATGPSPQEVAQGGTVNEPAVPVNPGSTFGGWYKEAACVTPWNFTADTVTADTTLWAKWAENAFNLSTNTGTGTGWTYNNSELRVRNGAHITIRGQTGTTHVVIEAMARATVILDDMKIDFLQEDNPGQTVWSVSPLKLEQGANLTLLLNLWNTLTAAGHAAALNAPEGTTLTITSVDGDGSVVDRLLAQVGDDTWMGKSNHGRGSEGAGIGGNDGENGGDITIKGGHVIGRCFGHGAGIGGGMNGHAGNITITGGAVEGKCDWWVFKRGPTDAPARGDLFGVERIGIYEYDWNFGFGGAGIGAGGSAGQNWKQIISAQIKTAERHPSFCTLSGRGSIVITGGTVHAWGGEDAAGIGGSASWVYPARIEITAPAQVLAGSGVCFWAGDIYVIGPGQRDMYGTPEPDAGTINVYGLPLSELRTNNGDWTRTSYPTHKGNGGYMEKSFNGGYNLY